VCRVLLLAATLVTLLLMGYAFFLSIGSVQRPLTPDPAHRADEHVEARAHARASAMTHVNMSADSIPDTPGIHFQYFSLVVTSRSTFSLDLTFQNFCDTAHVCRRLSFAMPYRSLCVDFMCVIFIYHIHMCHIHMCRHSLLLTESGLASSAQSRGSKALSHGTYE